MTWGMQISNANGSSIQYGTESIPVCIHAVRVELVDEYHRQNIIDTPVPYSPDISTFVSCEYNRWPSAPYIRLVNHNGYVRMIARLHAPRYGIALGTFRIYLVGRIPANVVPSGHGVAIWGSDGRLKFYSNYPAAPIMPITHQPANHYPHIGRKRAVWSMPTGTRIEGYEAMPGWSDLYHYVRDGLYHDRNSGNVAFGCISYEPQQLTPGGGWGDRYAYSLISMDTTDADAWYFGD